MRNAIAIALLLLTACATVPREMTPPADAALAADLRAMAQEDVEAQKRWAADRQNPAMREEMRQLFAKHVARLEEIIAAHGWPGITLVGFNGMNDAWLLAQHGGRDFLPKVLPLMYEAVLKHELDENLYATSLDRVLVQQGKKQMYGTQFAPDLCAPLPIEDPEHVDERRKRAGMVPLAEYAQEVCGATPQR